MSLGRSAGTCQSKVTTADRPGWRSPTRAAGATGRQGEPGGGSPSPVSQEPAGTSGGRRQAGVAMTRTRTPVRGPVPRWWTWTCTRAGRPGSTRPPGSGSPVVPGQRSSSNSTGSTGAVSRPRRHLQLDVRALPPRPTGPRPGGGGAAGAERRGGDRRARSPVQDQLPHPPAQQASPEQSLGPAHGQGEHRSIRQPTAQRPPAGPVVLRPPHPGVGGREHRPRPCRVGHNRVHRHLGQPPAGVGPGRPAVVRPPDRARREGLTRLPRRPGGGPGRRRRRPPGPGRGRDHGGHRPGAAGSLELEQLAFGGPGQQAVRAGGGECGHRPANLRQIDGGPGRPAVGGDDQAGRAGGDQLAAGRDRRVARPEGHHTSPPS